jgi:hypothetical protein
MFILMPVLCAILSAVSPAAALDGFAPDNDVPPVRAQRAEARPDDCGLSGVTVFSEEPESVAPACSGFARAASFMRERGYTSLKPLTIRVAARFPEHYYQAVNPDGSPMYDMDNMYGFYESDTAEVFMKTYAQFAKLPADRMLYGIAPSRELYASYVAHEAAHHISILGYKGAGKIPRVQTEFISYAAQMDTMEPGLRGEVLKLFSADGGRPFPGEDSISEMQYGFDPQGFTVKSWLFLKDPAGTDTMDKIMTGRLSEPTGF